MRAGREEDYHGVAVHPRHISRYERYVLKCGLRHPLLRVAIAACMHMPRRSTHGRNVYLPMSWHHRWQAMQICSDCSILAICTGFVVHNFACGDIT